MDFNSLKKNITKFQLCFGVFLTFIYGCSFFSHGSEENVAPDQAPKNPDKSQCPILDGLYHSLGKSNSTFSDLYKYPLLDYALIEHPSANNIIKIITDLRGYGISYIVYNKEKVLISQKKFDAKYTCQDGWMIFQSFSAGGSGEIGSYSENKVITKKTISNDRSTLIIKVISENITRSSIFSKGKKTISDVEYQYKKVKSTYE